MEGEHDTFLESRNKIKSPTSRKTLRATKPKLCKHSLLSLHLLKNHYIPGPWLPVFHDVLKYA